MSSNSIVVGDIARQNELDTLTEQASAGSGGTLNNPMAPVSVSRQATPVSIDDERMLEARGGVEPPMRVLQTLALPLGYRAIKAFEINIRLKIRIPALKGSTQRPGGPSDPVTTT
jgi:hypothetical protein